MNLKDAPMVPNSMARNMARKRTAKNGATVLADQDRILSTAWNLGDCNNKFVLMFVTKEGELVFLRKGEPDGGRQGSLLRGARPVPVECMLRGIALIAFVSVCTVLAGRASGCVRIAESDSLRQVAATVPPEDP